jgi:hypothetical protein
LRRALAAISAPDAIGTPQQRARQPTIFFRAEEKADYALVKSYLSQPNFELSVLFLREAPGENYLPPVSVPSASSRRVTVTEVADTTVSEGRSNSLQQHVERPQL